MRKHLTAVSSILGLAILSGCAKSDTGITESSFGVESGIDTNRQPVTDNEAKLQKETLVYLGDSLSRKETELFDEHGSVICLKTESFDNRVANVTELFTDYEYNADGLVTAKYSDGLNYTYEYENGLCVRQAAYSGDEPLWEKSMEYNDRGDLVLETTVTDGSPNTIRYELEYDETGRILSAKNYTEGSELIYSCLNTYDDRGNLSSYEETNNVLGFTERHEFTYDGDNNVIEARIAKSGGISGNTRVEYAYDDQNRCSRRVEHTASDEIRTEYIYTKL